MGRMILDGVPRRTAEALVNTHGELGVILSRMVCRTEKLRYPTAAAAHAALYQEWLRVEANERVQREALTNALKALGVGASLAWLWALASKS